MPKADCLSAARFAQIANPTASLVDRFGARSHFARFFAEPWLSLASLTPCASYHRRGLR